MKGLNKADIFEKLEWSINSISNTKLRDNVCVFISHKKEDKPACRKIASYLSKVGIDYYLDEEDKYLQQAVLENNPTNITESIKNGIRNSTHMLCVISAKTITSRWVPFEVGYGHAAIIDKGLIENKRDDKIKLSVLTLKDISENTLPEYLKVGFIIRGTKGLNAYISSIINKSESQLINEGKVFKNSTQNHPLDNVLNWNL